MPLVRIQDETAERVESFCKANVTFTIGDRERFIREATWDLKICTILDALEAAFKKIAELEKKQ